jgi:hypothetical protein
MTKLLEKAIKALEELPADEQDAMASLILDELADEERWNAAFSRSRDKLLVVAQQVREEIARGEVFEFDPSDERR